MLETLNSHDILSDTRPLIKFSFGKSKKGAGRPKVPINSNNSSLASVVKECKFPSASMLKSQYSPILPNLNTLNPSQSQSTQHTVIKTNNFKPKSNKISDLQAYCQKCLNIKTSNNLTSQNIQAKHLSLSEAKLSLIVSLWRYRFYIIVPRENENSSLHPIVQTYNETGVKLLQIIDHGGIPNGYENLQYNTYYQGKIAIEIRDYRNIKMEKTNNEKIPYKSKRKWLQLSQNQMIEELLEKAYDLPGLLEMFINATEKIYTNNSIGLFYSGVYQYNKIHHGNMLRCLKPYFYHYIFNSSSSLLSSQSIQLINNNNNNNMYGVYGVKEPYIDNHMKNIPLSFKHSHTIADFCSNVVNCSLLSKSISLSHSCSMIESPYDSLSKYCIYTQSIGNNEYLINDLSNNSFNPSKTTFDYVLVNNKREKEQILDISEIKKPSSLLDEKKSIVNDITIIMSSNTQSQIKLVISGDESYHTLLESSKTTNPSPNAINIPTNQLYGYNVKVEYYSNPSQTPICYIQHFKTKSRALACVEELEHEYRALHYQITEASKTNNAFLDRMNKINKLQNFKYVTIYRGIECEIETTETHRQQQQQQLVQQQQQQSQITPQQIQAGRNMNQQQMSQYGNSNIHGTSIGNNNNNNTGNVIDMQYLPKNKMPNQSLQQFQSQQQQQQPQQQQPPGIYSSIPMGNQRGNADMYIPPLQSRVGQTIPSPTLQPYRIQSGVVTNQMNSGISISSSGNTSSKTKKSTKKRNTNTNNNMNMARTAMPGNVDMMGNLQPSPTQSVPNNSRKRKQSNNNSDIYGQLPPTKSRRSNTNRNIQQQVTLTQQQQQQLLLQQQQQQQQQQQRNQGMMSNQRPYTAMPNMMNQMNRSNIQGMNPSIMQDVNSSININNSNNNSINPMSNLQPPMISTMNNSSMNNLYHNKQNNLPPPQNLQQQKQQQQQQQQQQYQYQPPPPTQQQQPPRQMISSQYIPSGNIQIQQPPQQPQQRQIQPQLQQQQLQPQQQSQINSQISESYLKQADAIFQQYKSKK